MYVPIQSLTNKSGEVNFRKRLIVQHSSHGIVEPGEPTFEENVRDIKNRLELSRAVFQKLLSEGRTLSPFLEIAGGQGYRSDFLKSQFQAEGFSSDISLHTQASHRILAKRLHFKKVSIKICADAYNLPFLSNSFPFVFIALSLHHFPHPLPIIKEAIRVMTPKGTFYFDEEPIKQTFNLNLWRRDYHLRWYEKILKATIVLLFLSRIGKAEVDHGILEETFSLKTWQEALDLFDEVSVEEKVFPYQLNLQATRRKTRSLAWIYPNFIVRLGLALFGGGMRGVAKLQRTGNSRAYKNIFDLLGCPNCRVNRNLAPLQYKKTYFFCPRCKVEYKKQKGVYLILPKELEKKLYGNKN